MTKRKNTFANMKVSNLRVAGRERHILPRLQRSEPRRRHSHPRWPQDIEVQFKPDIIVLRKPRRMRYRLSERALLQHQDIFVGDEIHKRIVDDIKPDILRKIILINTNRAILLQE